MRHLLEWLGRAGSDDCRSRRGLDSMLNLPSTLADVWASITNAAAYSSAFAADGFTVVKPSCSHICIPPRYHLIRSAG
ncbi:hypothetical protein BDD21_0846 [Thiocapsa rosea]|uniref:Uncharacterized protein n=1 Tax=Thiocapsa rosea TaxID=69360 RepID=A0A495V4B6_9GAMM|nr:hypothetical protein BDD21_0846 [Thiocapsa rosea]